MGFQSHNARCRHPRQSLHLPAINKDDNSDNDSREESELDELTPPSISFSRNSLLFGDNPPTQRNNAPLRFWRGTKSILPALVTGAWDDEGKGDTKPVEHLYNLLFVRIPTVCCMLVYTKNVATGHPLFIDFGDGAFEVPPLVVYGVILAILR
eukprot:CAMPEP_0183738336 /NCGR_PEP_ID=MMETSP0737-20130205/54279_1 /TAXON_ID=385413 /ORGANISM="Thalassiosira miniscula, Strain CCMP1093" /LENGTH=152 /DNA_ID=CAMNT_0025972847 /DNA_START=63 /DNA_END=521 /DNA_ORIENTATION=+